MDVVVLKLKRLACELLAVEGHVDVVEQACSVLISNLIECWHLAEDGSVFVDCVAPGPPIHRVVLGEIIGLLALQLVLVALEVGSTATDGALVRFVKRLVRLLVVNFCSLKGPPRLFNRETFLHLETNLKVLNEQCCSIIHIDIKGQVSAASDPSTFGGEAAQVNFITVHLKCLFALRIMNTVHCH